MEMLNLAVVGLGALVAMQRVELPAAGANDPPTQYLELDDHDFAQSGHLTLAASKKEPR